MKLNRVIAASILVPGILLSCSSPDSSSDTASSVGGVYVDDEIILDDVDGATIQRKIVHDDPPDFARQKKPGEDRLSDERLSGMSQ